jgi:phenylalanine ammonia-lyase
MDSVARMTEIATSAMRAATECVMENNTLADAVSLGTIQSFKTRVASRAILLHDEVTRAYLSGTRGAAPASNLLKGTRPIYEFVRIKLGIPMHGMTNYNVFANDSHLGDVTIGQNVSLIYEVCCSYPAINQLAHYVLDPAGNSRRRHSRHSSKDALIRTMNTLRHL